MAEVAEAIAEKDKIPSSYICSITGQIMVDPVFTDDGHTYEREAIEEWLKKHDTSPKTGKKLDDKRLKPNWDKKGDITGFLEEHPELYEKDEVYLPKSWVNELITAIKANEIKKVQECLAKHRRLLTMKLEEDYTAFHLAAQFGSKELANILLESLSKRGELSKIARPPAGFKPIHLNRLLEESLIEADKSKFSLLLTLGAEINQAEEGTQNTLLHKLAIRGNPEPVKWLLEKELAIESRNREGDTPLLLAVLHGHAALTGLLLKSKADPQAKNNQKQSAISIALLKKQQDLLTLLIGAEKAALPSLHLALTLNDLDLLKFLRKQGLPKASLEAFDAAGRTPFYYALVVNDPKERKEREEAVRLLLEAGADPTVACSDEDEGLTVLHLAAEQGSLGTLKLLLKTKATILMDTKDTDGNTPLHLAAKAGRNELIPYLLAAGADHEARNHQGQTPITLAESQSRCSTAALIVEKARMLRQVQFEELWCLRQMVQEQAKRISQLERMIGLNTVRSEEEVKAKDEVLEFSLTQLRLSLIGKKSSSRKFTTKKIERFLNHVVAGEQNEAEAMLKKNPGLALATGTVTDHAKRTFNNISGFQYAVWALDWHMWKMIRKYLSGVEATQQARSFAEGSWVPEHGEHADWKKLIEAYQTLITNWQSWRSSWQSSGWQKANEHWIQQIGGAQPLLPIHVLQEYDQSNRPFHPCPKFNDSYDLSRYRWNKTETIAKLGKEVVLVRGAGHYASQEKGCYGQQQWQGSIPWLKPEISQDAMALKLLLSVRIEQRAELIAELAKIRELREDGSEQDEPLAGLDSKEIKEADEVLSSSKFQSRIQPRSSGFTQSFGKQFKTTVARFGSSSSRTLSHSSSSTASSSSSSDLFSSGSYSALLSPFANMSLSAEEEVELDLPQTRMPSDSPLCMFRSTDSTQSLGRQFESTVAQFSLSSSESSDQSNKLGSSFVGWVSTSPSVSDDAPTLFVAKEKKKKRVKGKRREK